MFPAFKENLGVYLSLFVVLLQATGNIFFVVSSYERQQINMQSQISQMTNSAKTQLESLKYYVDANFTTLNNRLSQQQENSDKLYNIQTEQNKEINSKLDILTERLDEMMSRNT